MIDSLSLDLATEGYIKINSSTDPRYCKSVKDSYSYYSDILAKGSSKFSEAKYAFRNSNGSPRHLVDVLRDRASPVNQLLSSEFVQLILDDILVDGQRYYITHAKLSFKTKGENSQWNPHQDNGYKKIKARVGFAVFVCLEEMHPLNGSLQVYPKSNLLGTLPHKRNIESRNGDGQQFIAKEDIPEHIYPVALSAGSGDIVIFSQDTIHSSGQTESDSRRLALIFEVESYRQFALDDYGKIPILLRGQLSIAEKLFTCVLSLVSPLRWWMFLSGFPAIKGALRVFLLPLTERLRASNFK